MGLRQILAVHTKVIVGMAKEFDAVKDEPSRRHFRLVIPSVLPARLRINYSMIVEERGLVDSAVGMDCIIKPGGIKPSNIRSFSAGGMPLIWCS